VASDAGISPHQSAALWQAAAKSATQWPPPAPDSSPSSAKNTPRRHIPTSRGRASINRSTKVDSFSGSQLVLWTGLLTLAYLLLIFGLALGVALGAAWSMLAG
jgi:hypothetical protein